MDYEFDVFISYKNQAGLVTWISDHFQPFLQQWLDNELPQRASIFRDKVSIEAGDEWNTAIKKALARSKVVVAVLTPQYFTSKWCVAEWKSFERREVRSPATRNKLLIPVKYSNGHHFPGFATARQFTNDTDFLTANGTIIPPKSPEAVALENKIKALAVIITERLALAPRFARFPIVEPSRVSLPSLQKPAKPSL